MILVWMSAAGASSAAAAGAADLLPTYPNFTDGGASANAQARSISDNLLAYVKAWMAGKAPAALPPSLIPSNVQYGYGSFTLEHPKQVKPRRQWMIHKAQRRINLKHDYGNFNDPHATYLIIPSMFAPFGTKAILTGKFPHARFFDVQVSPPFDPFGYYYDNGLGLAEVPLLDSDIRPDRGSVNPFRVGAARNARHRNYTVSLKMAMGNAAELNPAYRLPYWRGRGNTRLGGGLEWVGPYGCPPGLPPPFAAAGLVGGNGCITAGDVWLRYYAPDRKAGPLGGVPLPKLLYQLPDGRRFYIETDHRQAQQNLNALGPVSPTPAPPSPTIDNPGWIKLMGIYRVIVENPDYATQLDAQDPMAGVRKFDLRVNSHGEDHPADGPPLPAPNSYEHGSTEANYIEYLTSTRGLPRGDVLVLTGRLPSTPKTRRGQRVMRRAQARYWSISGYPEIHNADRGRPINSLMDDQITVNRHREYVIAYSRKGDRPPNATRRNGVTWANWGPQGTVSFTIRWMDVGPQWTFCRAPSQLHLGWRADKAATVFDPNLTDRNDNRTFLGEYQPVFHLLSKRQFKALGKHRINPHRVPTSTDGQHLGPPLGHGPGGCPVPPN